MPVTNADCGVWSLDEVYLKIQSNKWVCYNPSRDPGQLWAWGDNSSGQLGQNNVISRSSPVQIPGTAWIQASSGQTGSFARKSDGTLWRWGGGTSSPIQIPGTAWTDISTAYHNLAIKSDNTLWAWGPALCGALGNNNASIDQPSPTQIPGTAWVSVTTGSYNVSFARKSDGTLWAWGNNTEGALGIGQGQTGTFPSYNFHHRSSPIQIPGTAWVDVSAGLLHALGRKSDGTLWVWGRGGDGQIGNSNNSSRSSPVQIPGTSWVETAAIDTSSLARKSDGTLWSWGFNNGGQLGDNTRVCRSSPIQVPGTSWVEIAGFASLGYVAAAARKSDNTLWVWGCNSSGQLGDNTTINRSSPVQIPGTAWTDIAKTATFVSLARKSN